jgi:hypothetical protein
MLCLGSAFHANRFLGKHPVAEGVGHRPGAGDAVRCQRTRHYIENIGTTTLRFLEIFQSDHYADVSLAQWLAFTLHELVRAHLNIDESVLAKIPTSKTPVVGG